MNRFRKPIYTFHVASPLASTQTSSPHDRGVPPIIRGRPRCAHRRPPAAWRSSQRGAEPTSAHVILRASSGGASRQHTRACTVHASSLLLRCSPFSRAAPWGTSLLPLSQEREQTCALSSRPSSSSPEGLKLYSLPTKTRPAAKESPAARHQDVRTSRPSLSCAATVVTALPARCARLRTKRSPQPVKRSAARCNSLALLDTSSRTVLIPHS